MPGVIAMKHAVGYPDDRMCAGISHEELPLVDVVKGYGIKHFY